MASSYFETDCPGWAQPADTLDADPPHLLLRHRRSAAEEDGPRHTPAGLQGAEAGVVSSMRRGLALVPSTSLSRIGSTRRQVLHQLVADGQVVEGDGAREDQEVSVVTPPERVDEPGHQPEHAASPWNSAGSTSPHRRSKTRGGSGSSPSGAQVAASRTSAGNFASCV